MKFIVIFYFSVLMVFFLPVQITTAQKIKLKLELQDTIYKGSMNPKWYEQVQVKTIQPHQLRGAKGKMQGTRFPTLKFIIEKNKTGTKDSLMIKTNNGWYPIEQLKWTKDQLKLTFDWGFQAPITAIDLKVLQKADQLLAKEKNWNPNDDRLCNDDFSNDQWSLYCLLKKAYLLETGDFNHRAAVLNLLREEISKLNPSRKYKHSLMEFNNEQSFQKVKHLIALSILEMKGKLK